MFDFIVELERFANFTPRGLMYRYAKEHHINTYTSRFDELFFIVDGGYYGYDHYTVTNTEAAEIVTVSLKLCF